MRRRQIYLIKCPYGIQANFEELYTNLKNKWLVAIGEVHECRQLVNFTIDILEKYLAYHKNVTLALEHFNTSQQHLIDSWFNNKISWDELIENYRKGPEGFNLECYKPLLVKAKQLNVKIKGVMPPRNLASQIARTGVLPEELSEDANPYKWVKYIESLSKLFPREGPMSKISVRNLLLAQSFKDYTAAKIVSDLLLKGSRILLVMGWAHVEIPGSVVKRVVDLTGISSDKTITIGARCSQFENYRSSKEHISLNLMSKFILIVN